MTQQDFGKASVEGYKPYTGGHVLDVTALLLSCEQVGIVTGAGGFFNQEQQRQRDLYIKEYAIKSIIILGSTQHSEWQALEVANGEVYTVCII